MTGPTFKQWRNQAHTEHNTNLAEGWEQHFRESAAREMSEYPSTAFTVPDIEYDMSGPFPKCDMCGSDLCNFWEKDAGRCWQCTNFPKESPPEMPEIVSGSLSAGTPEGDGGYTVWPRMERKIDRIREEGLG